MSLQIHLMAAETKGIHHRDKDSCDILRCIFLYTSHTIDIHDDTSRYHTSPNIHECKVLYHVSGTDLSVSRLSPKAVRVP
jgi:hypothetical protein